MVIPLKEYFPIVHASDVHDYGCGYDVGTFVGEGFDRATCSHIIGAPDWIITNPPFSVAVEFTQRGIEEARIGVAMLVRSNWAEGGERYEELFRDRPPTFIAQFCERVPMTKGRWDPDASTATSYSWFVWLARHPSTSTLFLWIPPGQRRALERAGDRQQFAKHSTDGQGGLQL